VGQKSDQYGDNLWYHDLVHGKEAANDPR